MIDNALIIYTMPLRTGAVFALLFAVAMGLHLVLADRGLKEHYPYRLGAGCHCALPVALLLSSWVDTAAFRADRRAAGCPLTALLGGSILLNVFRQEIPSGQRSSFPWFRTGLTIYAGFADPDHRAERVTS